MRLDKKLQAYRLPLRNAEKSSTKLLLFSSVVYPNSSKSRLTKPSLQKAGAVSIFLSLSSRLRKLRALRPSLFGERSLRLPVTNERVSTSTLTLEGATPF